jgi:hypothetical protein
MLLCISCLLQTGRRHKGAEYTWVQLSQERPVDLCASNLSGVEFLDAGCDQALLKRQFKKKTETFQNEHNTKIQHF